MAEHNIDADLAANYEALRESRGCTWEQFAREQETHDPNIAAWFRSQSDGDKASPKSRRAPAKDKG